MDLITINTEINEFLKDNYLDDKYDYLYYRIFKTPCKRWGFIIDKNGNTQTHLYINSLDSVYKDYKYIDYKYFRESYINKCDYSREFMTAEGDWAICCLYNTSMLFVYNTAKYVKEIIVFDSKEPIYLKEFIRESKEDTEEDSSFTYITRDPNGGFNSAVLKINHNLNVSLDNYNEDLPYDKMKEFSEGDTSGLMLLSGLCGTGKTTLIKKLIHDCKDTQFILLSADTLSNIDSTTFMSYLIKNGTGAVLVMEDCDTLLKSRDLRGDSSTISTLLNLSDGILGDALNLKFICTYNTNETNIDKALLRKGRLKLKYVFGKLAKDRVHKLNPTLNTDMTLAEIYNTDTNNYSEKKTEKVGF